ncbi:MAG: FG-GAP-like repeat-containing protein [Bacteroidota bacterium]
MKIKLYEVLFAFCVAFLSFSCRQEQGFSLVENSGVDFINRLEPNDSLNLLDYEYFYNGGGVAVGDFNNDGLEDIFMGGNLVSSKLYLNDGNLTFTDRTTEYKLETDRWITGVNAVDINSDGWLDLYLCTSAYLDSTKRENLLFINTGEGYFEEKGAEYKLNIPDFSTQSYFFDYDRDDDLDLFLVNHSRNDHDHSLLVNPNHTGTAMSTDKLLRNDNGHFVDISRQAGIDYEGYGLSASILDVNEDGWLDIYVANDYIFNDLVYLNNGDGTFKNALKEYFDYTSHFSMGMDHGDVNRDGHPDIMVADMLPPDNYRQKLLSGPMNYHRYELALKLGYHPQFMRNTLQIGSPNHTFSEQAFISGVAMTDWSWSILMEDYDLDGWEDVFITNGYVKNITDHDFGSYSSSQRGGRTAKSGNKRDNLVKAIAELDGAEIPNYIFRNKGNGKFDNASAVWGIDQPSFSNGAASADFDLDGDLDLVVNNINQEAFVYENVRGTTNKSIQLKLLTVSGVAPEGAVVKVTSCLPGVTIKSRVSNKGYLSTSSKYMTIGVGRCEEVNIEVFWPSGKYTLRERIATGQVITMHEEDAARTTPQTKQIAKKQWIKRDSTLSLGIQENRFVDFNFQSMLPITFSENGPAVATVDVDKNGWDDLVVGTPQGNFTKIGFRDKDVIKWIELAGSATFEDQGLLVFDADGDSDLDIYVASGGYESFPNSIQLRDRLYLNDGDNQFKIAPDAVPTINQNSSVVRGADYDNDGDIDLFVGGDVYPKKYPLAAQSLVLENINGKFKEVTNDKFPGLKDIGIIKTALWSDFNNDGLIDLIAAGLFTEIVFFKNTGNNFLKITEPYTAGTKGWWMSSMGADLDLDGDIDYILGNWGENVAFQPSEEYPLITYVNDFDQNNTIDFIAAVPQDGEYYPLAPRNMLLDQIGSLKKAFPNYRSYARVNVAGLPLKKLATSARFEVETFRSVVLRNQGNETFTIEALPASAQTGPILGITPLDLNGDGFDELILTGGWEATEVIYGPQTAFKGAVLSNTDGQLSHQNRFPFYSDGATKAQGLVWDQDSLSLLISKTDGTAEKNTIQLPCRPVDIDQSIKEIQYSINGQLKRTEIYLGHGHYSQNSYRIPAPAGVDRVKSISY